jgi:hypothetical protein
MQKTFEELTTGIKDKSPPKRGSTMGSPRATDRSKGDTVGSTVIDNISALVNQDFKDFEGLPIRKRLDQSYYNSQLLNRI